jgi:hypothetical protein
MSVGAAAMDSKAMTVLSMDTFGPITDNANGVNEMAGAGKEIRKITDRLDAVGNTTKALTKIGHNFEHFILGNKSNIDNNLKNLGTATYMLAGKRKRRRSGKRRSGKRKSSKRRSGKRRSGKRRSGKRRSKNNNLLGGKRRRRSGKRIIKRIIKRRSGKRRSKTY